MGTKYINQGLSTYITAKFLFGLILLKRHRLQLNNIMDKRTKKIFLSIRTRILSQNTRIDIELYNLGVRCKFKQKM